MSLAAYRRTIVETESPKQVERRILLRINAELAVHQEHFDNAAGKSEKLQILSGSLRPALARTVKFWSALRVDLISPSNALPEEQRAGLINLSLFMERQVAAVLAGRGTVKALVDVNNSIIAGLAGNPGSAA